VNASSSTPTNVWLWLFQRVSAVLLVVILGVHLWLANFGQASSSLRAVLGVVLLGLALFHGLNGVRTVIFDFNIGVQGRKFTTMLLLLLGVVSLLFGMYGLWPLIVGG
jgi:succinate dehydrogenase / fumarate reductase, membrane anchor subunit